MQVRIRMATAEDAEVLAKLERDCFLASWSEETILATLSRRDFVGAIVECENQAVGYVIGLSLFENAEILRIAVSPQKRRLGFGAWALDFFLAQVKARGAEQVFLEVRISNESAISLYTSRGFEQLRERENYYENGETAVEMRKIL